MLTHSVKIVFGTPYPLTDFSKNREQVLILDLITSTPHSILRQIRRNPFYLPVLNKHFPTNTHRFPFNRNHRTIPRRLSDNSARSEDGRKSKLHGCSSSCRAGQPILGPPSRVMLEAPNSCPVKLQEKLSLSRLISRLGSSSGIDRAIRLRLVTSTGYLVSQALASKELNVVVRNRHSKFLCMVSINKK